MQWPPVIPYEYVSGTNLYIVLGVGIAVLVLAIVVWWLIFHKAGYSGALGLLMFVPVVNVVMLLILAFGRWPVRQEVQRLRAELRHRLE